MCSFSLSNQLHSIKLNATTLLLFWSASDAFHDNCYSTATSKNMTSKVTLNRLIQGYAVEVTDDSTGDQTSYKTDNRHLVIDNLQPHHQYTFRVAIVSATDMGPYSQPLTVILNSTEGKSYKAK